MTDKIRFTAKKPKGTGRRVGWIKVVSGVDDSKRGGYAFEGQFLKEGQVELEIGSVLVGSFPVGSARSGSHWRAGVVGPERDEWEDRTWPPERELDFRDHVKALLAGPRHDVEALRDERARHVERIKEIDLLIEQYDKS